MVLVMSNFIINWWRSQQFKSALRRGDTHQFLTEIPDKKYWVDSTRALGKQQAIIRFTNKFVESPLLKNQLQEDSVLKNLLVLRAPNSTNFKVSSEEWEQVQKLIQEK